MTGSQSPALAGHPFLRGMPAEFVGRLATAGAEVSLPADHRLFEEGGRAARFWLIRSGHVALDIHVPGRERLILQTISDGDVVGLSWLAATPEWQFGAEAIQLTTAFELDGAAVIRLCDSDPSLGYQVTRRLLAVAVRRLRAIRIRMLDLYAATSSGGAGAP